MQGTNDKIVKSIVKKVGAHQLGVDEINFFRDDNTILHFKNPEGTSNLNTAYASIQNNTFIVSGESETKAIKDLLPDIIQQLGPKQHRLLQELIQGQASSDDAPELVPAEAPAATTETKVEELNKPE